MADFVWGQGGAQMTPERIASLRKVADALAAKGMDTSPVQSWSQGAARVAQAALGAWDDIRADRAERANRAAESELLTGLLSAGGGQASTPSTTSPAAIPATAPVQSAPPSPPMPATDDGTVPVGQSRLPETQVAGALPAGKEGFVSQIMPMAVEASKRTGVDPRIIVAQAALESGWGRSAPGNNLFGIKSHGQPGGTTLPTTEIVNGQPVRTQDSFRSYASPQDSVSGYADFITSNPRYRPMREAQGLDAQIAALGASGYATDPQYGSKIAQIARSLPGGAEDPAALPPNAQLAGPANAPVPGTSQPAVASMSASSGALGNVNPKLVAALASPYVSEGTKKIVTLMLQNQMQGDKVTSVDLGNKIGLMDGRGNIKQFIDKGEPNRGPEFGVIGKDQFGNEQYGWKNPRDQSVIPYNPAPTQTGESAIPPAPAGVDPKVWREAHSKRISGDSMPASFDDTQKVRHEVTQLPSYKNLAQAAPIYRSMVDTANSNSKASDLNLVYGLGKIMDPNSVVREGEMVMVKNTASLPDWLVGAANSLNGGAALTPETREAILKEAHNRVTSYKSLFDQDASMYRGIAQRNRMNELDVIPDFGEFKPWARPATKTMNGKTYVKIGDQWFEQ